MTNEKHIPVLLNEVIDGLNIRPDGIYVDLTLGRGGHSEAILKRLTTGLLIGIDQDEEAIKEKLWIDVKEVNKTMPKYKYIKGITVTTEPLIKTTTLKIKRFEEIKRV